MEIMTVTSVSASVAFLYAEAKERELREGGREKRKEEKEGSEREVL